MKYGKFLPDKGTIGFVAPSFGCGIEPYLSCFENAGKKWRQMGYGLDYGPNCYEAKGIGISNTPANCGGEFMDYYLKKDNDCLISCGGGELMCEILDHIDFARIKEAEPKWFMGYSDNTHLTHVLATHCDVASVYGPCAGTFGMEPWHESLTDAMNLLTGKSQSVSGYPLWEKESYKSPENPLAPYHVTEERVLRLSPDKDMVFTGRIMGGCMDCLVNILGTRYDRTAQFVNRYQEDGIVWFLEACELNVFSIRRAMWQMEHAGWFANTKGFVIGRPGCMGQEIMGLDAYEAVMDTARRLEVPVVMDADIGHVSPMMPIVIGSLGQVTVRGNKIQIKMEYKE